MQQRSALCACSSRGCSSAWEKCVFVPGPQAALRLRKILERITSQYVSDGLWVLGDVHIALGLLS